MVNKRGWLKTLEAVIAILLILIVVYSFLPKGVQKESMEDQLRSSKEAISEGIMYNEELRTKIINTGSIESCKNSAGIDLSDLTNLIDSHLPNGFSYSCRLCTKTNCIISNVPKNKDVFVTDVLLSSTMEEQNVVIVRIAFWMGNPVDQISPNN